MNSFGFYLLTDTHYFESSLGAEGTAFDEYMRKEQYFMKETDAIIKPVFKRITDDKETDIVIIPGDLSKNGEKESHKSFLKELYRLKENGKKIFVITAGHDYNEHSFGYKNDERIQVEGTPFEELFEMYRDFGYGDAVSFNKRTNSYVAQLKNHIECELACVVRVSSRKYYRKKPIYKRHKKAGTRAYKEPRSELAEAGPCFINDCRKKNVVDNIPYANNKSNDCLEA